MLKKYLSVKEVVEHLKITIPDVQDLCRRGEIKVCIYAEGHIVIFDRDSELSSQNPDFYIVKNSVISSHLFKGYIFNEALIKCIRFYDYIDEKGEFDLVQEIVECLNDVDIPLLTGNQYIRLFPRYKHDNYIARRWLKEDIKDSLIKFSSNDIRFCSKSILSPDGSNLEQKKEETIELQVENEALKQRLVELEGGNNIDSQLVGIHAINQHKKDLQGMARVIANKLWLDDESILMGNMADIVYREIAKYTDHMPENLPAVKSWIRSIAPESAKKKGRPSTKK